MKRNARLWLTTACLAACFPAFVTVGSAQSSLEKALEAGKKSRREPPAEILEVPSSRVVVPGAVGASIKKQDEDRALRSLDRAIDERNAQTLRDIRDRLSQ